MSQQSQEDMFAGRRIVRFQRSGEPEINQANKREAERVKDRIYLKRIAEAGRGITWEGFRDNYEFLSSSYGVAFRYAADDRRASKARKSVLTRLAAMEIERDIRDGKISGSAVRAH